MPSRPERRPRGVWLSCRAVLPEMLRRGGGSIVLTSSVAGTHGVQALSPYLASKHAVIGLAGALSQEAAQDNIELRRVAVRMGLGGRARDKVAALRSTNLIRRAAPMC